MPHEFRKTFEISKVSQDERMVFGFFSIAKMNGESVIDSEDEFIDPAELEKAAYEFNLVSRQAGKDHRVVGVGRLVESWMCTKAKQEAMRDMLEKAGVKEVAFNINADFWYGGFRIDDEHTWDLVKSGEYTCFSIGGFADKVSE